MTSRASLPLAALVLCACEDPSVTETRVDLRTTAGADLGQKVWRALPEGGPALQAEVGLGAADRWRELKRDPFYLKDGDREFLYFAGSPAPPKSAERWSLGRLLGDPGQALGTAPYRTEQVLAPGADAGRWDSGNLYSPSLLLDAPLVGKRYGLFYAASGDANIAPHALQVGLARSDDGRSFARPDAPLLAAGGDDRDGLFDPCVVQPDKNTLWIYYAALSCDGACRFQIVRQESRDGIRFSNRVVVLSGRAGVPEETGGVAAPGVLLLGDTFYLSYTAVRDTPTRDAQSIAAAIRSGTISMAVSGDGVLFVNRSGDRPLVGRRDFYAGGSYAPALYAGGAIGAGDSLGLFFAGQSSPDAPPLYLSIGRAALQ